MGKIKILIGITIGLAVLTSTVASAGRPTVIITFDDGWYSVLQNAKPIMDNNGQKGVAFIIANQPELSWNGQPNNYMNVTQLQQLYNSGWDLSSHTYSHAVLTTVNDTTLNYELSASMDWLNTHGFSRGAMFLAYPEGAYNSNVTAAVKANHYVAARTIEPPDTNYPNYNLASPDVYTLKAYETIGGIGPDTDNDTTVINQINKTIAANGLLILAFHKIVDNLSSDEVNASTEFTTSDFQNVSNYLQSRSSEVDVRTLSDYFGAVPSPTPSPTPTPIPTPTYMPPTPINTTLDGSKNLTWAAGVGNVTDYFNYSVNGTWFNGSDTTFYNMTDLGQNYTIKVYAVNSTNGITVNSTPLTLNGTVSATQTPTPTPTSSPAVRGSSSSGSSGGSSSGGSSGGGGGGSGGESGEDFSNVIMKEKHDGDIYINKVTQYILTLPDNPIRYINISGNVNAGETTTTVEVLKNTSSFVNYSAPGTVYKNVNIWVGISGFAVPRNIKEAVITFRVENSWISSNSIKNSNIKMVRWDGSKWNLLETSEKTKDDKYTYFEAKTNAFSPFAITELEGTALSAIPQVIEQSGVTGTVTGTIEQSGVTGTAIPNSTITEKAPGAPSINFAIIIAIFAMIGIVIAVHLKRRGNF